MSKIKPLAKKRRFRLFLRRLFGLKPRASDYLANIDEMHTVRPSWNYDHTVMRTAPVTCILGCPVCSSRFPRLAGVNYYFCPHCGTKMADEYVKHESHPDGRTIAQTIIDEVPSTDYQKIAERILKEVAPGYPEYAYKCTAVNLDALHSAQSQYDKLFKEAAERLDGSTIPYSPIEMNIKVVDEEEHTKMHQGK